MIAKEFGRIVSSLILPRDLQCSNRDNYVRSLKIRIARAYCQVTPSEVNGTEKETPSLVLEICEFHQSYF